MLEEKKIGQYILKKFVCTLICVGIAQLIINVLFSRVIGPSIADLLKIELLDQGLGLKEAMWFTLHWLLRFLIYFIPSKFSFFRLHFVERVCSYFFTQNYSNGYI